MSEKKIIAVAGATGAQGGGLVRAIQADASGAFRARAVTRNPESEAAQKLKAIGAEVVQGDLEDPTSIRGPSMARTAPTASPSIGRTCRRSARLPRRGRWLWRRSARA